MSPRLKWEDDTEPAIPGVVVVDSWRADASHCCLDLKRLRLPDGKMPVPWSLRCSGFFNTFQADLCPATATPAEAQEAAEAFLLREVHQRSVKVIAALTASGPILPQPEEDPASSGLTGPGALRAGSFTLLRAGSKVQVPAAIALKPHAETWTTVSDGSGKPVEVAVRDAEDPRQMLGIFSAGRDYDGRNAGRLRLAAQAPALARALLRVVTKGEPLSQPERESFERILVEAGVL